MWQLTKAARRDATANQSVLGPGDTNDLISMVSFTFAIRRHLIGWYQYRLPPTVWQSSVGFRLLTSMCEVWR